MSRILGLLSLVGFGLAAVVHVASLAGVDVSQRFPLVWLLHIGIFVLFIPFAFSSRRVLGKRPSFSDMRALIPGWVFVIGVAVFGYALLNFALFIASTQGGSPSIEEGKYVLQNHGHVIREITEAEYVAFRANELRGFSGHWLAFYFAPFAYFMFAKSEKQRSIKETFR